MSTIMNYVWWLLGYDVQPAESETAREELEVKQFVSQEPLDIKQFESPGDLEVIPPKEAESPKEAEPERAPAVAPLSAKSSPALQTSEVVAKPSGASMRPAVTFGQLERKESLNHVTKERAKRTFRRTPTDYRNLIEANRKKEDNSITAEASRRQKEAAENAVDEEEEAPQQQQQQRQTLRPPMGGRPAGPGFGKIDLGAVKLKKVSS